MLTPSTWASVDHAVRDVVPRALDALRCGRAAAALRALAPIVDSQTASAAVSAVMSARSEALSISIALELCEWTLGVAYAAQHGNERFVRRRAARLKESVDAVLVNRALAEE